MEQIRYIEGASISAEEGEGEEQETLIEYTTELEDGENEDMEQEQDEVEEEEEGVILENLPVKFQKVLRKILIIWI